MKINKYFKLYFLLLIISTQKLVNAQCDFNTSMPVIINQTGTPYTGSGAVTTYVLVDNATGNVVASSATAPANFGSQAQGSYTAYAINYLPPAPTGISIGSPYNPSGTCLSTASHLVTVCNQTTRLINVCSYENITVISNPDFVGTNNMVYVLVNAAGNIVDYSAGAPTASFPAASLAVGNYTVYAVNYSSPASPAAAGVIIGSPWSGVSFTSGCFSTTSALANVSGSVPCFPLPVKLTYFKGQKLQRSNLLEWETSMEENNSYFNLQKSTDAVNFKTIQKVVTKALNGNSSVPINYNYEDMGPQIGHNYYQLEQVDINGHSSKSNVVDLIWTGNAGYVSIYPNPAKSLLNIDIYQNNSKDIVCKLIDMSGRIVRRTEAYTVNGLNTIKMDISDIASGIYSLQIISDDQIITTEKVRKED